MPSVAASTPKMERARQLVHERDAIEKSIAEIKDALDKQGGVGMDGPLIDAEGFPRADIDVYQVRTLRHEMARLLFDFQQKTKEFEEALFEVHSEAAASGTSTTARSVLLPFAIVNEVSAGSPAATAGIQKGDLILRYGNIDASNHRNLQALGELTAASEGREILVQVRRPDQGAVDLLLTPKKWAGRGLLGCHLLPHDSF